MPASQLRFTSMSRRKTNDPEFEIRFFETVLRHSRNYAAVVELLAGLYTKQGRIADGLKMDRRLVRMQPTNATAHYNLACSLALTKQPRAALRALQHAVELGYRDSDWMQQDPDLDPLKGRPEFAALVEQLKQD